MAMTSGGLIRRLAMSCVAIGMAVSSSLSAHAASDFPNKPVTIVVPFPPGGPFDIIARTFSNPLSQRLGVPVLVDNAPGASGMIGTAKAARAKPDGYTILLGSSGTQALNPNVFANVPYRSPEDFEPIAELASMPSILVVNANSPFKSVTELVAHVVGNPGKLTLGNAGAGSVSNQAALTFLAAINGKVTPISYKGTAPAFADLIGGQIDAMFDTAVQAIPQIRSGKVRALAVTSANRLPNLPDVPTLAESCCAGTDLLIWYGLLTPVNVPGNVKEALSKAVLDARADPQFVTSMKNGEAIVPPSGEGMAEFGAKISRDVARFSELVRRAGVVKQ